MAAMHANTAIAENEAETGSFILFLIAKIHLRTQQFYR